MEIRMGIKKRIALIAHDNMKHKLIEWVLENKEELCKHELCGTGTTASLIAEVLEIDVFAYKSGPMGGDVELSSAIANDLVDVVIFFVDPLSSLPHDPDIKALLRISILYDIPIANNRSTASFILYSKFFNREFLREIIDQDELIHTRKEKYR